MFSLVATPSKVKATYSDDGGARVIDGITDQLISQLKIPILS